MLFCKQNYSARQLGTQAPLPRRVTTPYQNTYWADCNYKHIQPTPEGSTNPKLPGGAYASHGKQLSPPNIPNPSHLRTLLQPIYKDIVLP